MKIVSFFVLALFLLSCGNSSSQKEDKVPTGEGKWSYGVVITKDDAVNASALMDMLSNQDEVAVKLTGNIIACCQHSGCWMDIKLDSIHVLNVTFKDGSFTVPTDLAGKTAYLKGIASKEVVPVETLRNYAREEGKSVEEVDAITEPEVKYSFEASGVLIEE